VGKESPSMIYVIIGIFVVLLLVAVASKTP
jgi:hypothetical protein